MSMKDAILGFAEQFSYEPAIENADNLKACHKFIVLGMGGSHLEADLLLNWDPRLPVVIHSDYGLPSLNPPLAKGGRELVIASSYSGNTEEIVDGLNEAIKKGLNIAVIATGGKLIDIAKENNLPYVQMPSTGIQPRSALGYSTKAILKIMGLEKGLNEISKLVKSLNSEILETEGQELAKKLKDHVPVIYASDRNSAIAYNWKIKFNETGKIPAFYNVFPELNHNEMTGFPAQGGSASGGDVNNSASSLSSPFHFIFLEDASDHPRIKKRMSVTKQMYEERGLPVEVLELESKSQFEKIFRSLLIADWAAVYTAELYGLESEQVSMIEEFKKLIA